MKFEQIKDEFQEEFCRLTGIKLTTFDVMINILNEAKALFKSQEGKPALSHLSKMCRRFRSLWEGRYKSSLISSDKNQLTLTPLVSKTEPPTLQLIPWLR